MKNEKIITIDDIDQANSDIRFIRAVVDVLSNIDGSGHIDELKPGTVSILNSESADRIERIKAFIDSVPANALPADIVKMKAA